MGEGFCKTYGIPKSIVTAIVSATNKEYLHVDYSCEANYELLDIKNSTAFWSLISPGVVCATHRRNAFFKEPFQQKIAKEYLYEQDELFRSPSYFGKISSLEQQEPETLRLVLSGVQVHTTPVSSFRIVLCAEDPKKGFSDNKSDPCVDVRMQRKSIFDKYCITAPAWMVNA